MLKSAAEGAEGASDKRHSLIKNPGLPAGDCDVLYGVAAIGRWLGMTRAQVKPLIDRGIIPSFKLPGLAVRCALKSAIHQAFAGYAKGLDAHPIDLLHISQRRVTVT